MSKKSKDTLETFHDYSVFIPTRTIFVGSEENTVEHGESGTDSAMAERLIKNLIILESISSEPISIIMNNIGGDEFHGMAMYDAIKSSNCHITIKAYGHAMSMGAIILQAGDVRLMSKNSRIMIHYGTSIYADGDMHPSTTKAWSKEDDKFNRLHEDILLEKIHVKNPSFTRKKLKNLLNFDTILDAKQSLKLNLIDGIIGDEED